MKGTPTFWTRTAKKCYAYHPSSDRWRCIGIDSPHLCMACGAEFDVVSRAPIGACPTCSAPDIADTWTLERKPCPHCKVGHYEDSGQIMIS